VGSFHSGTTDNVIPDEARFEATIRTFSAQTRAQVKDGAVRVARGIGEAHGLTVSCEFGIGYPVTVNDRAESDFAAGTVRDVLGDDRFVPLPQPATGSEDFSFVLGEVPGAFLILGACPRGVEPSTAPYNHSPDAAFDDAVLSDGATVFSELAIRRLASPSPA
jgi:hippurate hydrolase